MIDPTMGADTLTDILVQSRRPVSPEDRAALERAGLRVGTVIGDIVTGQIRPSRVGEVAKLPWVARWQWAEIHRTPPVPSLERSVVRSPEPLK